MKGKYRAVELAEKLEITENQRLWKYLPKWFADSREWATAYKTDFGGDEKKKGRTIEGLRLSYILNHLCPNLANFKPEPKPGQYPMDVMQRMLNERMMENTQIGCHYSRAEFKAFRDTVNKVTGWDLL